MKTVQDFIDSVNKVAKEYPEVFNAEMFIKDWEAKMIPIDKCFIITDTYQKRMTVSLFEFLKPLNMRDDRTPEQKWRDVDE